MLLTALLGGLGCGLGDLLGHVAGHLLAVLERFLAGLLRLLDQAVRGLAETLILDLRRRQREAHEKADGDAPEGDPDRVLLGDPHGLLGAVLQIRRVGSRLVQARPRAAHLATEAIGLVGDRLLHPRGHVGLVGECIHCVTHSLSRLLYLLSDLLWLLAHSTSSLTVSTVCSGTGG